MQQPYLAILPRSVIAIARIMRARAIAIAMVSGARMMRARAIAIAKQWLAGVWREGGAELRVWGFGGWVGKERARPTPFSLCFSLSTYFSAYSTIGLSPSACETAYNTLGLSPSAYSTYQSMAPCPPSFSLSQRSRPTCARVRCQELRRGATGCDGRCACALCVCARASDIRIIQEAAR